MQVWSHDARVHLASTRNPPHLSSRHESFVLIMIEGDYQPGPLVDREAI